jgi:hypothetical protein
MRLNKINKCNIIYCVYKNLSTFLCIVTLVNSLNKLLFILCVINKGSTEYSVNSKFDM